MDQHGFAQAIGGVNEKIEGFFWICHEQGLDGNQGVIIPAANRHHLMLNQDVVQAAEKGLFHIHTIENVDDAAKILLDADPALTTSQDIDAAVTERLREFHQAAKSAYAGSKDDDRS